jgi:outer membrane protein
MRLATGFIPALMFSCALTASAAEGVNLSLPEAMARAAGGGRDINISLKQVLSARDQADMAGAGKLPQVTASAGRTYYAYQPASMASGQKLYTSEKDVTSYGMQVHQTLFDFGVTTGKHKVARILANGAQEDAVRVKNQSVLNVIVAYFDVLEAERMARVAVRELVSLARHMKDVSILYHEGVATRNDLLSASVRFNGARQKLVNVRSQQKIALARIKALLSMPEEERLVLEDIIVPVRFDIAPADAYAQALNFRPELRVMENELRAAELNEAVSRASDKPELFADGGYGYAGNRYQARDDNWHAFLGVRMNVFNGGLTRAETSKAKHDKEKLIEEKKKLLEDVRFEIDKVRWEMDNARERVSLGHTSALQADENMRVNEARYLEGVGLASDVLDALAMRSASETEETRGTYELKRAYARFLYAMGSDLSLGYLAKEADHVIAK